MQKNIELRPINAENVQAAFDLQLEEHQKDFVMHPMKSLAYCYIYSGYCHPFGIYDGNQMVGYTMIRHRPEINACTVWHLLIDKAYQRQGYGTSALAAVLDYIRTEPFGKLDKVLIACHLENSVAYRLYQRFGFREVRRGENIEMELNETN